MNRLVFLCAVCVVSVHCGIMYADLAPFPSSNQTGFGTVVVSGTGDEISLSYSLGGLVGATGGFHIHAGSSCDTQGEVGGHFWKNSIGPDPWIPIKWVKTGDKTVGVVTAKIGYTLGEVNNHTVVAHNEDGTKAACGVLRTSATPVAHMGKYPGYTGSAVVSGTVSGTNTGLVYDLYGSGIVKNTSGGLHIHTGSNCTTASGPGGHYWAPSTDADPWLNIYWQAEQNFSLAKGLTPVIKMGVSTDDIVGHAVVAHWPAGKIGCGLLAAHAELTKIPSYTGNLTVLGYAYVVKDEINKPKISFKITGLDQGIGQVHIHEARDCNATSNPHFYNKTAASADPWNKANCPVQVNTAGVGMGEFNLNFGYDVKYTYGRTFIVHSSDGTKVACGKISGVFVPLPKAPVSTPVPTPAANGTSPTPAANGTSPTPAANGTSPTPATNGTSPTPATNGTSPPTAEASSGSSLKPLVAVAFIGLSLLY